MAKKKSKKDIRSWKNIVYSILIGIIIILLIWYAYSWHVVKNQEKYINSYLISSNTINLEINDISEIVQVLRESPSEYFVLVSYTGDEKVFNLEKKLKTIIDNYNLKDEIYYVNITSIKDDDNFYEEINEAFNTKLISSVPTILYFKNNELEKVIPSNGNAKMINEFEKVLRTNGFEASK